jgi:hypothetical protein
MKKFFYSLIACILVGWLAVQQASAVVVVHTIAAGSIFNATNLIPAAATINTIRVDNGAGGGATNLSYSFTDFPFMATIAAGAALGWTNTVWTNAAYVQVTQYLTNQTRTITNFAGLGFTGTFPAGSSITNIITQSNVLWSITNTVAASTTPWRRIANGQFGSNSINTITGPFSVGFGLGFTNNNIGVPITITIDYDSAL